MLTRLTRAKRLGAGWFLTILYLFCVLAPGVSLAFAENRGAAHCLTDGDHRLGAVHVHDRSNDVVPDVHEAGAVHANSAEQPQLSRVSDDDEGKTIVDASAPASHSHDAPGPQCCGVLCLSALPAAVPGIVEPSVPNSVCSPENYRNVADNAPPRLYRPPIA